MWIKIDNETLDTFPEKYEHPRIANFTFWTDIATLKKDKVYQEKIGWVNRCG